MTERASPRRRAGGWADSTRLGQLLIDDLVRPTTEVARVIAAVADGDLTQKMALTIEGQPVKGEFLRIGTTVNTMVDQLASFADEVTRVAREVGTEGRLGGQAEVTGVVRHLEGPHRLGEHHGVQPDQPGAQHRPGDHRGGQRRPHPEDHGRRTRRGRRAQATRSTRWSTSCSSFADEVTRVAREVGTEGKLGGQAEVPGVAGTWKDLTDSSTSWPST